MNISVIIPTLNEANYVGNLLDDLSFQEVKSEVIIVDGRSGDNTVDVVRSYKGVKLFVTKPGVANQRNYGAKRAGGDILIFLDADVRIAKNFISNCLAELETRKLDICCPFYSPYKSSYLVQMIYMFFNSMFYFFQHIAPSGAGSCIICKKTVFKSSYGFDQNLRYDDIEMIRRYSRKFKFRMLKCFVFVSDRRFKKEGPVLVLKYILLSLFFLTGLFKAANSIPYEFGKYK